MTYATVEIEVDLSKFETSDLMDELKSRNGILRGSRETDLNKLAGRVQLASYSRNWPMTVDAIQQYFNQAHGFILPVLEGKE